MTDINDMRVSGDTLSHLLLLTSEPGAVLLDRPSFLWKQLILLFAHNFRQHILRARLFTIDDVNSDTDQDQAYN